MNAVEYDYNDNYFDTIKGVKIYIDYTNNRIKILENQDISENTIMEIINLAKEKKINKVISYCRIRCLEKFKNCGFIIEGIINGFFNGENAHCLSVFLDDKRKKSSYENDETAILRLCIDEKKKVYKKKKSGYIIRNAREDDIPQMIELFSNVFQSYPTPVFNSDYLKSIMADKILFKVAIDHDNIIAIASAEMDKSNMNAEITDCATYLQYRGKGINFNLIKELECDLKQDGFHTLYSLARAINPGINKVFSKLNYRYSGRMINNCHICGNYEDMNIWVKILR